MEPTATHEPLALSDVDTLDDARLDRLGTHLAVTAAADVAAGRSASGARRPRRLVGGIAVAGLLAAGLFTTNALVGGPGPAAVSAAVAIEQADGWTTIEVLDPQASPAEIEAALDAAGLDARVEVLDPSADKDGVIVIEELGITYKEGDQANGGQPWVAGAFKDDSYAVTTWGEADPGELVAMGVTFAPIDDFEDLIRVTVTDPDAEANESAGGDEHGLDRYLAALEQRGVRAASTPQDASKVSIRDGADVEVVLYALA